MEKSHFSNLTDRNDLDEQLHDTFKNCQQLLRLGTTKSRRPSDLRKLLKVASGGIIFTTIQKFDSETEDDIELPVSALSEPRIEYIGAKIKPCSLRTTLSVIRDEAHRSQYDFGLMALPVN